MNANKVSMWSGILAIPSLIIWYVTGFQQIVSAVRSSPDSVLPSISMGAFVMFAVIALIAHAVAHNRSAKLNTNRQESVSPAQANVANPALGNTDELYRTYDGPLLRETEQNVRTQMERNQPANRENYLLRGLTMLIVLSVHEMTWLNIFGSQLRALNQLNGRTLTYDEMRTYYNEGANSAPFLYQNRPFESWLAFLRTWTLVLDIQPASVQITVRGRDFLRYCVQSGYDQNMKLG